MEQSTVVEYKINKIIPGTFKLTPKQNFSIQPEQCDVSITLAVQANKEEKQLHFKPEIEYIDQRTKELLATYNALFSFDIVGFDQVIKFRDTVVNVPNNLMLDCFSIVIGTTRGMLLSETKGTYLEKIYFPIFNVVDFLNQLNAQNVPPQPAQPAGS